VQVNVRADEGGSEVSIDVRGREHGGEDYWDGNWLQTRVSVRAGAFRGAFDASLRVEEFIRMWNGVRVCMTALDGTFVFETMDDSPPNASLKTQRGSETNLPLSFLSTRYSWHRSRRNWRN